MARCDSILTFEGSCHRSTEKEVSTTLKADQMVRLDTFVHENLQFLVFDVNTLIMLFFSILQSQLRMLKAAQ
jgi:hypothetical protein